MLGSMFGHAFHALLIFQKFLISDHFAALFGSGPPTPAHTLMHTPHPPTHSVAPFNHVCTRAACRGALVGATSATATWVDVNVRFGLVSHSM